MIEIIEAKTKREMKSFATFPVKLYKRCKEYVPSIVEDEMVLLDGDKNFSKGNNIIRCFLAYKNHKLVGRIAGIIVPDSNQKFHEKNMRFSRIDFVEDMSFMFYGCTSLERLPNISSWNSINVNDMSYLFRNCSSLKYLSNLSQLNTINVTNISYMFYGCISLSNLSDISNWNISNVTDMSAIFYDCTSLTSLPDISKWDTSNIIDLSFLFYECTSLISLPDLSKWKVDNVKDISFIINVGKLYDSFFYCYFI